jgi:hypothetical protein
MTPTVTGAPDGADAAPAAALVAEPAWAGPELPELLLLLEHAAASTAKAETTAPNQRRRLSEFRIISLILSSLAPGPHTVDTQLCDGQRSIPHDAALAYP